MIIKDVIGYQQLPQLMKKRGFSQEETEKILYRNVVNTLASILM